MPEIQLLPPNVVNKIAAGEVIERPASVVKELVENALDAGASRIDVAVEKGGVDLLRVSDNGCGIAAAELPLAVAAHATSKIRDADDLFRVGTLGFRGEALASIAEVSRFVLRSRPAGSDAGAELEIVGGKPAEETDGGVPCGCPGGTTVEVRNLFFNTPVRRKFLKSTQTEMGHVSETITRLALAHPQVHFTLRHNDREVYDLPPTEDWRQRIARFFGQELAEGLIPIERTEGDGRLFGYVANPSHSRPNNRQQYLFLNGRYIRDRSLQHALGEGYRGLLLTGRYPIAFVCFEVPPDSVDVNVHPTKLEVRFEDGGRLYSLLLGTLRTKFLTTDLHARWKPSDGPTPSDEVASAKESPADSTEPHDAERAEQVRQEFVAWAKGELAAWERDDVPERQEAGGARQEGRGGRQAGGSRPDEPLRLNRIGSDLLPGMALSSLDENPPGPTTIEDQEDRRVEDPTVGSSEPPTAEHRSGALQIHNRYLIAESDDGMMVIDQHALHERVLYEQLREKVLGGAIESQALLVPEAIDLSPAEAAAVLEHQEVLAQLGVKVEPFGGDTVLVSSYPAMLANLKLPEMLRGVIDQLMSDGKAPDRRDVLDELLHMMSCKAAVKAGDRLTPEEIDALLAQRHLAQDTHHCPHGRPTALVLTREELDRQFLRT